MTNTKTATPGTRFHWLQSGMTFSLDASLSGASAISQRGQTVTLTQKLLDANRNRYGETFLDLIYDEAAQVKRWGSIVMAPGEAPEDLTPWTPNSPEETAARDDARRLAYAITDGIERQKALKAVSERFPAFSTQVSSALDGGLPGLDGGTR
jgi:hypothetical protein